MKERGLPIGNDLIIAVIVVLFSFYTGENSFHIHTHTHMYMYIHDVDMPLVTNH